MRNIILTCWILAICNANVTKPKLVPTIRLNNGYEMPAIGLGTYKSKGGDVERAVKDAIDVGYRHIDTAYFYENEVEIGNAVRQKIDEGKIKREDIFITSKLWNIFHEPDQVEKAFQRSFDDLNLDYIDLYLIHFPVAFQRVLLNGKNEFNLYPVDKDGKTLNADVDYVDTWKAMEKLVETGRVRSIGISNFNSQQVDRLYSMASIKPVTNQVECHPNLNQRKLIEFCAARNITITAYSPLARPSTHDDRKLAISDPKVSEMSQKYKKTPAQIILRYTIQNGAAIIPKSTHKNRIEENFDVFDFELSASDMEILHGLNNNYRLVALEGVKENKYFPFNIEF